VLNESAAISLVLVDVLVDRLVTHGEGSVESQVVGDLLWAPVLLHQRSDDFPKLRGQVEAASLAFPPSRRIAVGQIRTVPTIDKFLIAFKFATDSTR
jgi:hypothetical protein